MSEGDATNPAGGGRYAPSERDKFRPATAPVIALRMESLLTWTAERVAKFPRDHKFTVGDRLIETCLDVMAHITDAAYRRDKLAALAAASRSLTRARVLARLAAALRCLSGAQHLHFVKESDEVGKMLGGWLKASQSR